VDDENILRPEDTADVMPARSISRRQRDPRAMTADEMTRLSVTTSGPIDAAEREEALFGRIQKGMRVVDAAGETIGKVELVSMGDPDAATTKGQEMPTPGGIIGNLGRALTGAEKEPDVPEPLRSQLVRVGYLKVDGKGWIDTDRYLTAEMIATVTDEEVRLSITRDALPTNKASDL
jgi:hypothetical protein